jgi:hypothetical protein
MMTDGVTGWPWRTEGIPEIGQVRSGRARGVYRILGRSPLFLNPIVCVSIVILGALTILMGAPRAILGKCPPLNQLVDLVVG